MWGIVLVSTIYSFIYVIEISSLLKVIKGIIYIPLGYLAYVEYKCNPRILCKILYSYFYALFKSMFIFVSAVRIGFYLEWQWFQFRFE